MDEVSENWVEIKNKNVGNAIDAESEEDRQKIIYANYLEQKDAAPFSIEFKDLYRKEDRGYLYYTIEVKYTPYVVTSSEDNPSEDESGNLMSNCIVLELNGRIQLELLFLMKR